MAARLVLHLHIAKHFLKVQLFLHIVESMSILLSLHHLLNRLSNSDTEPNLQVYPSPSRQHVWPTSLPPLYEH